MPSVPGMFNPDLGARRTRGGLEQEQAVLFYCIHLNFYRPCRFTRIEGIAVAMYANSIFWLFVCSEIYWEIYPENLAPEGTLNPCVVYLCLIKYT